MLEEYLGKSNATLLMVTHDRYFLDRVCNQIIEIDKFGLFSYSGNYAYYLEKREERIENRNAAIDKARNLLRTEQEWMRRMPQARSHKAQYRIDNFYKLKETASQNTTEKNWNWTSRVNDWVKKSWNSTMYLKASTGIVYSAISLINSSGEKKSVLSGKRSGQIYVPEYYYPKSATGQRIDFDRRNRGLRLLQTIRYRFQ